MGRGFKTRFRQPFSMDIPLPMRGMSYMAVAKPDFDYCRDSWNIWVSPAGDIETRPSVRRLTDRGRDQIGRIQCEYWSQFFREHIVAAQGILYRTKTDENGTYYDRIGNLTGSNEQVSMVDFFEKVYIASGGQLQEYDGTTLKVPTPAAGMVDIPVLDYLQTYQERLWGINSKDSCVWGSSYRAADDWGDRVPDVDTGLGGHVFVRPGDGSDITGFCVHMGKFYVMKSGQDGRNNSFWVMTGDSFRVSSGASLFAVKLINSGIGCISPFTVASAMNSVIFCGHDGNVYSESLVDEFTHPESVPINQRVKDAFIKTKKPISAVYQPYLGYYFLILEDSGTLAHEIWAYHVPTQGWWRWDFPEIYPVALGVGPDQELFIGDRSGATFHISLGSYGVDGDDVAPFQYISGLAACTLDSESMFDKYWDWFYVDYLPIGPSGQIWVDFREGRGYSVAYTGSLFSDRDKTQQSVGWDMVHSKWDSPEVGWDMGGIIERRCRMGLRASTMQLALQANTPFRLIGWAASGGKIARKVRGWAKGVAE